ncbi:hypothetical protein D3C76_421640 [compost metagenome]
MTDKTTPAAIAAADLPAFGQPLADGIFVTRYWLNGVEYALIELGAEQEFEGEWSERDQSVEGAKSYSDGLANTVAMAEAGSLIARKTLEIGEGVFIPAALELNLLFAANDAGEISSFEDPHLNRWYWSSSKLSATLALRADVYLNLLEPYNRDWEFLIRPVRKIPILQ